jgi:hypothetical protein
MFIGFVQIPYLGFGTAQSSSDRNEVRLQGRPRNFLKASTLVVRPGQRPIRWAKEVSYRSSKMATA